MNRHRVIYRAFSAIVAVALLVGLMPTVGKPPLPASISPLSPASALAQDPSTPVATASTMATPSVETKLDSADGKVSVLIPAGAANEDLRIEYKQFAPPDSQGMRFVKTFELKAYAVNRGDAPVARFTKDLTITLKHDKNDLAGIDVSSLRLYYLDEQTRQWVPQVGQYDADTKTLVVTTNHFTYEGEIGASLQSGPGRVMAFQTDLHSGTATASYPIEVPDGRGGFKPRIALTYSSGGADEMKDKRATGSWVGIGWTLHMDRISMDTASGAYFLDFNGGSYSLIQTSSGGPYYTQPDIFAKITRTGETWDMWDNGGIHYRFGGTTDSQQYYWDNFANQTAYYRWDVSLIEDTHSNQIVVSYQRQTVGDGYGHTVVRAAYPQHVTYNGTHVDIVFNVTWSRPDNPAATNWNPAPIIMESGKLDSIEVKVDSAIIRKYVFAYNTTSSYQVYEYTSIYYSGKHTLSSITEYGQGGTSALPATSFTYVDLETYYRSDPSGIVYIGNPGDPASIYWPHLQTVNSGYGGSVTYGYTQKPASGSVGTWTRQVVTSRTVSSGITGGTNQSYNYTYTGNPQYGYPGYGWSATYYGFGQVRETDAANNYTDRWFYAAENLYLTGREYKAESRDSSGNLLRQTLSTWEWKYNRENDAEEFITGTVGSYPFGVSGTNVASGDAWGNGGVESWNGSNMQLAIPLASGAKDLAVSGGYTYIISANQVLKYSGGSLVATWNGANGGFNSPSGIATDASGYIYVADTGNNRIQKYDGSGALQAQWGGSGNGDGQFSSPQGIDVDANGNVYVADTGNNRVQKFTAAGEYQSQWGSSGSGNGQFNNPVAVASDVNGYVYVVDRDNHRIQKFDSSGVLVNTWGSYGSGYGKFQYPRGISTTNAGNGQVFVYVSEYTGSFSHWFKKFKSPTWVVTLNQVEETPNSSGTPKGKKRYVYDYYGNVTIEYIDGDTGTSADDSMIVRDYYPNTSAWIVDRVARERVYEGQTINPQDLNENLKRQTLYYYDGNDDWTDEPTEGDLTKVRSYSDSDTYIETSYEYDTYGNQTEVTDPNGVAKSFSYDVTHHTYPVASTYPVPWTGLVGYWKLDEGSGATAADSSGNGNTGTLINDPAWAEGNSGQALQLDGTDNYVDAGGDASLRPNLITVAAWVKLDALGTNQMIVDRFDHNVQGAGYILKVTSANKFDFGARTASDSQDVLSTTTVTTGVWYYVAGVWDGANLKIYVNGVLEGTQAMSGTNISYGSTRNVDLGRYRTNDDSYFHGSLDEVRIYNRALTADEIKNFVETTTWDYGIGKMLNQTGVNGSDSTVTYTYDTFGRPEKVIRPGDSSTYPTVLYAYHDFGTIEDQNVEVQTRNSGADYQWQKFFFDGIGRIVETQARGETEDQTTYAMVTTKTYNNRGLVDKEYVSQKIDDTNLDGSYYGPQTGWKYTTYVYDGLGRVTTQTNPDETEVSHTFTDWQDTVTDPLTHKKVYYNDAFGRLVTVEELDDNDDVYATTTYAYDVLGNLVEVQDGAKDGNGDPDPNITTIVYDWLSRKTEMDDPDMGTWSYVYDDNGNLTNQTDAKSQELKFIYDALNRMTSKQKWNGTSYDTLATYSYDSTASGNYGKGLRTGVSYGSSLGDSDSIKYDARSRVIQEVRDIDDTTYTTGYSYDSGDRLVTVTYPGNEEVTQTYNDRGLPYSLETSVYMSSYVDSTLYNNLGQITDISLLLSSASQTFGYWDVGGDYDNNTGEHYGKLWETKSMDAFPVVKQDFQYTWDDAGNLTHREDVLAASGVNEEFSYDFLDRLTEARFNALTFGNSGSGQTSSPQKAAFDPQGNILVVDQANSRVVKYAPDGTYITAFGGYGTLDGQFRNPTGIAVDSSGYVYVSDATNARIQKFYPDLSFNSKFGSYGTGNSQFKYPMDVAVDSSGYIYVADAFNYRVKKFANSPSFTYQTASNTGPSPLGLDVDSQDYVYAVDGSGYLKKYPGSLQNPTTYTDGFSGPSDVDVDPSGNMYVADSGNNRIVKLDSSGTEVATWSSAASGQSSFSGPSGVALGAFQAYVVDTGNNRVQAIERVTLAHSYNEIGNITESNGVSYTYQSASPAHPHALTHLDSTPYATYDANGNMTDRGDQDITWDAENRPVTVTGGATFYYDGDGNRYKKVENDDTTVYVNKYYEINTDTEEETRYYYFGGKLVLFKKGGVYGDYHVVNQDHLGGTSGTMYFGTDPVSTVSYEPFGGTRSSTGTTPTDKLFTGQRLDGTGLYYYNARYYDATVGRFISADPAPIPAGATAALNHYSYAYNNPLKYIDPSGLFVMFIGGVGTNDNQDASQWDAVLKALGLKDESGKVLEEWAFLAYDTGPVGGTDRGVEALQKQLEGKTDVKLVGFSMGGAVAMEYLAQMAEGKIKANVEIKKAITMNSPLSGDWASMGVGFDRLAMNTKRQNWKDPLYVDRLAYLSGRLNGLTNGAVNVGITNVVDPNNVIGHDSIPGVAHISVPTSDWFTGHFRDWGVHGNILADPSGWAPKVKWR